MSRDDSVVTWLVNIGYPYDFSTADRRFPKELLRPLAEAWYLADNVRDGEIVHADVRRAHYFRSIRKQTGWGK